MYKFYFKNKESDFYSLPWYADSAFLEVLSLAVFLVSGWFYLVRRNNFFLIKYAFLISAVVFWGIFAFELLLGKFVLHSWKRAFSNLVNKGFIDVIASGLLDDRSSSVVVSKSFIRVPRVFVYKEQNRFFVRIRKLAGSYETDLPKLAESVNSAIGGRYVVTSQAVAKNGNWFLLEFCPIEQNLRFVPKKLQDLYVKPYSVKLMNNLTIDMNRNPHVGVFGLTGSAKSTVLWTIVFEKIASMHSIGESLLFFLDGKGEFASLSGISADHFSADSASTLQVLKQIIDIMNARKPKIKKAVHDSGLAGLTACDLNLKPVFLFVDEFASILANFQTPKEKKQLISLMLQVLQQGRSLGVFVIFASQSPSTEVIPQQLRMQLGTVILLGTANADIQRMAFGEVATTGTVPKFTGYYIQKIADMPTPQYFETPDIFKYSLNNLKIYEKILKKEEIK